MISDDKSGPSRRARRRICAAPAQARAQRGIAVSENRAFHVRPKTRTSRIAPVASTTAHPQSTPQGKFKPCGQPNLNRRHDQTDDARLDNRVFVYLNMVGIGERTNVDISNAAFKAAGSSIWVAARGATDPEIDHPG